MTDERPRPPDERRAKLERLRADGVEPFPHAYGGVVAAAEVHRTHGRLDPGAETDARYRVAGRLAARRGHGGAAFIDLVDRSGRLQLHARRACRPSAAGSPTRARHRGRTWTPFVAAEHGPPPKPAAAVRLRAPHERRREIPGPESS